MEEDFHSKLRISSRSENSKVPLLGFECSFFLFDRGQRLASYPG